MKKTVTAILTALAALSAVTAVPANALTRELQVPDEIGMYWDITEDPISGDAYYSDLNWLGTGEVLAVTTPAGLPVGTAAVLSFLSFL